MKKTNNKGFSLVELIVVIAIMAVLIGVLAPTFTKYVEQSRRSTDIQTAEEIKQAILADMADGSLTGDGTSLTVGAGSGTATASDTAVNPSTIFEAPEVKGSVDAGGSFTATYSADAGSCQVFINSGAIELTDPTAAQAYKTGTATGSGSGSDS